MCAARDPDGNGALRREKTRVIRSAPPEDQQMKSGVPQGMPLAPPFYHSPLSIRAAAAPRKKYWKITATDSLYITQTAKRFPFPVLEKNIIILR